MKPAFEKILPVAGSSWSYTQCQVEDGIPFEWHHHPEYELTLTLNSEGHRYVGNSIERYADGDLVLLGANIPHSWNSESAVNPTHPHVTKVMWFTEDWVERLVQNFPELYRIKTLTDAAACGVAFGPSASRKVRPALERLAEEPDDLRLVGLLSVLQQLSRDPDMRLLSPLQGPQVTQEPRLNRVLDYLHENYIEPVSIEELADLAHLSVSAFHRMFRKHIRATPLQYAARLRIGRACSLLIGGKMKIGAIASTVGYESVAQFNKEFRRQKGMAPREFQAKF